VVFLVPPKGTAIALGASAQAAQVGRCAEDEVEDQDPIKIQMESPS
jgi:hypothetical protein